MLRAEVIDLVKLLDALRPLKDRIRKANLSVASQLQQQTDAMEEVQALEGKAGCGVAFGAMGSDGCREQNYTGDAL